MKPCWPTSSALSEQRERTWIGTTGTEASGRPTTSSISECYAFRLDEAKSSARKGGVAQPSGVWLEKDTEVQRVRTERFDGPLSNLANMDESIIGSRCSYPATHSFTILRIGVTETFTQLSLFERYHGPIKIYHYKKEQNDRPNERKDDRDTHKKQEQAYVHGISAKTIGAPGHQRGRGLSRDGGRADPPEDVLSPYSKKQTPENKKNAYHLGNVEQYGRAYRDRDEKLNAKTDQICYQKHPGNWNMLQGLIVTRIILHDLSEPSIFILVIKLDATCNKNTLGFAPCSIAAKTRSATLYVHGAS